MNKLIEAINISKSFMTEAGELQVLKNINMSVLEGELLSIVGASGAGKSTLLHILGCLDRPTSGTIRFKDREISYADETSLAAFRNSSIGFVFQFHHLLPEFSALENVMLPAMIGHRSFSEAEKRARYLLEELGLGKRLKHRPGELSGGEQQRVAVARALIQEPSIVLADEPTGNLDTATGNDLFELFLDLNNKKGITFIIVTHNITISERCHRIMRMSDGVLLHE